MKVKGKFRRTLAHLTATPFQSRWLDAKARLRLAQIVAEAEKGHGGEIRLVIEKSLPLHLAWRLSVRERALDVFAHYRVWDTKARSGVLVYLNLAERRLEIVADRGIDAVVAQETWQGFADQAVAKLYEKRPMDALETLIGQIADRLRTNYGVSEDSPDNELSNEVVFI